MMINHEIVDMLQEVYSCGGEVLSDTDAHNILYALDYFDFQEFLDELKRERE